MNTPNPALTVKTGASRALLRPSRQLPRPIPYLKTAATTMTGRRR